MLPHKSRRECALSPFTLLGSKVVLGAPSTLLLILRFEWARG
jgi:hypothetical protein